MATKRKKVVHTQPFVNVARIVRIVGLCTPFFKTSTWYLKILLYHADI